MFKDAEIIDFAAPYGVFSVARRFARRPAQSHRELERARPGEAELIDFVVPREL